METTFARVEVARGLEDGLMIDEENGDMPLQFVCCNWNEWSGSGTRDNRVVVSLTVASEESVWSAQALVVVSVKWADLERARRNVIDKDDDSMTDEEYLDATRAALSGKRFRSITEESGADGEAQETWCGFRIVGSRRDGEISWALVPESNIKYTLGKLPLKLKGSTEESPCGTLLKWVEELAKMEEVNKTAEKLRKQRNDSLTAIEAMKKDTADESAALYTKFKEVLNQKKSKAKQLHNALRHQAEEAKTLLDRIDSKDKVKIEPKREVTETTQSFPANNDVLNRKRRADVPPSDHPESPSSQRIKINPTREPTSTINNGRTAAQSRPSSSMRAGAADSSSDDEPPIRLNFLDTRLTAVARAKPMAGAQPAKKDEMIESVRTTTPKPRKRGTVNEELALSPTPEKPTSMRASSKSASTESIMNRLR
ncbi:hypothetical protein BJ742DRAFT_877550 [Cladochytrium replicatum]|nr:hypothetical protein BJ742DRAFT_877550 [Cladochytrium replicatum]